jgi:hypothetical protein
MTREEFDERHLARYRALLSREITLEDALRENADDFRLMRLRAEEALHSAERRTS